MRDDTVKLLRPSQMPAEARDHFIENQDAPRCSQRSLTLFK